MKLYDCVIVGGGPAGLSAAIYLARFNRNVLVVDKKAGRSSFAEVNENYLGFPTGIPARKLRRLGKQQAERFGAEFTIDEVVSAKRIKSEFRVEGENDIYRGRTIIIATGVVDLFPEFEHYKEYVGKSLFWCITCDGYKTRNKRVVIIGKNDEAAVTCMQFLNFTKKLVFVTNCSQKECNVSEKRLTILQKAGIPIVYGQITGVQGKNGMIKTVELDKGRAIPADFMFNQQGAKPLSKVARSLGVVCNGVGYVLIDEEQRTNVPFVYAAGDVTKAYSQQIVTAAYEGAAAGQRANYDLYTPEQREIEV